MEGLPVAYQSGTTVPDWHNKGDIAWQMIAATIVGMQSMPGLIILYGSIVKKKWAVNSAFMALYAFAAVLICWVTWAYKMSFGDQLLPFWGKAGPTLGQKFLIQQAIVPETIHHHKNGTVETPSLEPLFPMATLVFFQFVFAAITLILLAGSLLGRMNIKAWMVFVPLWLTFSYTVGAFSIWGGGFLFQWGVIDFSGGYVIHLSSGIAGFTAAYWVCNNSLKFLAAYQFFLVYAIDCLCCLVLFVDGEYRSDLDRLKIGKDFLQTMCCLCWLEQDFCGWVGQGLMVADLMLPMLFLPWQS